MYLVSQAQPALGCVYKLVQIDADPRIKLSQEIGKVTIPGRKVPYRLIGSSGIALVDILCEVEEPAPTPGTGILCRHPFEANKRAFVTPSKVGYGYPTLNETPVHLECVIREESVIFQFIYAVARESQYRPP